MFNLIPWKKRNSGSNVGVLQDPKDEVCSLSPLRDDFDAMWDRFLSDWNRGLSLWNDEGFGLSSGLEDKENEFLFHADLPGFEPDEIDVKISGSTLQVTAEHKEEKKAEQGSSYRYGSFQRYFTLPRGIDDQNIEARYHNGVLEVHLPKTERAKGKRIPVS